MQKILLNNNSKIVNYNSTSTKKNTSSFKTEIHDIQSQQLLASLEKQFGKINIQSIANNKKAIENYIANNSTCSVTIAKNVLEDMVTNAKLKEHITDCIKLHQDSIPAGKRFLAAHGRRLIATGTIVHEDGTVTHWCLSDYTPEEKERLEKQIEKEQKEKDERAKLLNQPLALHNRHELSYFNKTISENTYRKINELIKYNIVTGSVNIDQLYK